MKTISRGLCKIIAIDLTCAGKPITGVSRITGTDETVRYVDTSGKLTASAIVLSAFIHICVYIIMSQ